MPSKAQHATFTDMVKTTRVITISTNVILCVLAGDLYRALFSDQAVGIDGMINELLVPNANDNYSIPRLITLSIPCALYIYELLRVLDYHREKGLVMHHSVALLLTLCCENNTSGALLSSFGFFLSDCAALPLFLINWRGKMGPTVLVTLNYTLFRIPFIMTLLKICFFVFNTSAKNNPYNVGMCLLIPLIVAYSLLNIYKLWRIMLIRTLGPRLRVFMPCMQKSLQNHFSTAARIN